MRKMLVAAWLLLWTAAAGAYPADLEIHAGALHVDAAVLSDGRLAIVQVHNLEQVAIRCEALFRNGPEQGRTRRATIGPAEQAALSWMPRRTVVRLRVELSCLPAD